MNPHVHKDLIIAWANGAEIEVKCLTHYAYPEDATWCNVSELDDVVWLPEWEYRIKPIPKPDVVLYSPFIDCLKNPHDTMAGFDSYYTSYWSSRKQTEDRVKVTFDGETGKLKHVEII